MKNVKQLDPHHIHELTDKAELVNIMGEVLRVRPFGDDLSPPRFALGMAGAGNALGLMPEVSRNNPDVVQTKFVALGAGQGHNGYVFRFSAESGNLEAIFTGKLFTSYRTAATSVAVAKFLRPFAHHIVLIGTGEQSVRHFQFFRAFYPDAQISIVARSDEARTRFSTAVGRQDFHATAKFPARSADIICTLTASPSPVLFPENTSDKTLVIAVGACHPLKRELAPELLARANLFVDSLPQAEREAGDFLMARKGNISHLRIEEIGRVFRGEIASPTGRTVYKSLGLADQDIAYADYLLEKFKC